MDFLKTISVAASGLKAQSGRMRVIAENIANADSTASVPGGEPYRRKIVTFKSTLDRQLGVEKVAIGGIKPATGDFERRYDPSHPAADADGYVMMPNVNPLVEIMDMREAQRGYQANLTVIDAAKSMISRTIELLHG